MCGIAGIATHSPGKVENTVLAQMASALEHRGPDANGLWVNDHHSLGLAHTRLSIIDLTPAANQPLFNETKSLSLVCNGEIYNHKELRAGLEAKGHRFKTNSDSEVILHLYEDLGENCVNHLKGMFAFAIFDEKTRELFCCRDRFGKKPFFYSETPDGFAFASEIPSLLSHPHVNRTIDPTAVGLYLLRNLRHIPDPYTIFQHIRRLPPGHLLKVKNGHIEQIRPYWHPSFETRAFSQDDLLQVLDQSVARRMVADVEVAALLSGGVDSSAIVDSMKRQGAKKIRTYAFGRDQDDPELIQARKVASLLETEHKEFYFDPEEQHRQFESLLSQLGEPIMALPLTHTYSLCQHIRQDGIKVVLSGHGADEVFYGYTGFNRLALLSLIGDMIPSFGKPLLKALSTTIPPSMLKESFLALGAKNGHRKEALYRSEAMELWPKIFHGAALETRPNTIIHDWISPWFKSSSPRSYIDEAAYLGLMLENAHAVTIASDLPAMAHGIEMRCPFLDDELISLALSLPYSLKVRPSLFNGQNKLFLKKALESRLPKDILYAPKRGFGYHIQEEAVLKGAWKTRVDDAFNSFQDLSGLLDREAVKRLKKSFDANQGTPAILIAKLYALHLFQSSVAMD